MKITESGIRNLPTFKPRTKRETHIAQTLGGKYEFLRCLKKSSTCAVYEVLNKSLDRVEALKVFLNDLSWDNDFLDRFKIEAKICASLAHPNIVTIYHYKKLSDFYYFSMFFVDGPTLTRYVKPPTRMPDHDICSHIATICDAIGYAHERGVIHRDVKASNIMLDQSGKPYIADFGIAKFVASETQTQTGAIMGTPHYVSPEQAEGLSVDGRADIYSLGITLYALLTQRYPFQGNSPMSIILKRLSQEPIPPEAYRPDLPPRLKEILNKTLHVDRRYRYQTTAELAEDLNDFADSSKNESPDAVFQASPIEPDTAKPKKRRGTALKKWMIAAFMVTLTPLLLVIINQDQTAVKEVIETPAMPVTRPDTTDDEIFHKIKSAQLRKVHPPCPQLTNLVTDIERKFEAGDDTATLNAVKAANAVFDQLSVDLKDSCRQLKGKIERYQSKVGIKINDRERQLSQIEKIKKHIADHQLSEATRLIEAMRASTDLAADIEARLHAQHKIIKQALAARSSLLAESRKTRKQLDQLAAGVAQKCANSDYQGCLEAVKAAKAKIDNLPADRKREALPIKQTLTHYQSKAEAAIKDRKQKIAVIDIIKDRVADGQLEEAMVLIDAVLLEPDLSPDLLALLRSQRNVIKRISGK